MTRFSPTAVLRNGLRVLVPLSLLLTAYLYLFPVFSTCAFPLPPAQTQSPSTTASAFVETAKLHWPFADDNASVNTQGLPSPAAPFRLLALGDPQLEGDTSIPTKYLGVFPHFKSFIQHVTFKTPHPSLRQRLRQAAHDLVDVAFEDTYNALESARKVIDLFGNDFYLAHIYRTVHWWTRPTHIAVLGDLMGSQWVHDGEFSRRANRYWNRVFRGAERIPDELAAYPADEYDLAGYLSQGGTNTSEAAWTRRIINVAGNHDIGYAGDITTNLTERFERAFGKVNYELRFELVLSNQSLQTHSLYDPDTNPSSTKLVPELRLVILNDMNLDTPAKTPELQDDTYSFVNNVINTAAAVEFQGHYTIILTHIPLYKPTGVCVDPPMFDFYSHDGTVREQNQLSAAASKGFLEGILGMSGNPNAAGRGMGRKGIILNGHDHEGCDTWHFINQTEVEGKEKEWEVKRWRQARRDKIPGGDRLPGVREVTVRSMMGDFGGNAGLLSVWFDEETWEWKAEYGTCPLGTQHLWWLVHILDLIVVVLVVVYGVVGFLSVVGVDVDGLLLRKGAKGQQKKFHGCAAQSCLAAGAAPAAADPG
ncbi:hypothetical protein QBC42DRAFT_336530 [Cladorrhinum samala]|uniref:Calcineurin-like phosphoesterase domain-containing protein n=1 Tax=Cladorrhinum samala TaxID=585594 RepID=A0AAV9HYF3_9PEZI|nr:hypothetical protein QBC42DRAFT_336530 [Cladorrhinum samala]